MEQPKSLINLGQSMKKIQKRIYSHTKREISKHFLYFYHEIEFFKDFFYLKMEISKISLDPVKTQILTQSIKRISKILYILWINLGHSIKKSNKFFVRTLKQETLNYFYIYLKNNFIYLCRKNLV